MQTVVINNREALIIGQLPHAKSTGGVPQLGPTVTFIPGLNLVDSKVLAELRQNPSFEAFFKTKIEASPAPEQNPEKVGKFILATGGELEDKSPLGKLKEQACQAMISETFSSDLLKKWRAEETRGEVTRMINEQLDKLSGRDAKGGPAANGR